MCACVPACLKTPGPVCSRYGREHAEHMWRTRDHVKMLRSRPALCFSSQWSHDHGWVPGCPSDPSLDRRGQQGSCVPSGAWHVAGVWQRFLDEEKWVLLAGLHVPQIWIQSGTSGTRCIITSTTPTMHHKLSGG